MAIVPFCNKTVKSQRFCERFSWFSYHIASDFHKNTKTKMLVTTLCLRHTRIAIMLRRNETRIRTELQPPPLSDNVGKPSICYTERRKMDFFNSQQLERGQNAPYLGCRPTRGRSRAMERLLSPSLNWKNTLTICKCKKLISVNVFNATHGCFRTTLPSGFDGTMWNTFSKITTYMDVPVKACSLFETNIL